VPQTAQIGGKHVANPCENGSLLFSISARYIEQKAGARMDMETVAAPNLNFRLCIL